MKINIKIIFMLILMFIIIGLSSNVQAATATISANKTSATVGDSVTITVKISAATWNLKVSGSGISGENIVGYDDNGKNVSTTKTYTLNTSKAGSYKISLTGDITDGSTDKNDDINKSVTVTVKEKTTTNTSTGNTSSTNQTPTFTSVNETVYAKSTVNVRKSWSTSSSSLGTLEEGESITRTGKGSNGWDRVTYKGTTAYIASSYLTTTKPTTNNPTTTDTTTTTDSDTNEKEKSKDSTLKSISIEENTITPAFDKKTTKYTLSVSNEITELKISAETTDSKAKYTISENAKNLQVGENEITITVTAEDKTTTKYVITVTREEREKLVVQAIYATYKDDENNIIMLPLNPEFSQDTLEYDLGNIPYNINEIYIEANANLEDAQLEIKGNEDLKTGENIITITATFPAKDEKETDEIITYTLTVNKEEEPVVVPPTIMGKIKNWFKGITGTTTSLISKNDYELTGIIFIISAGIIIILIICIIKDYKKYKLIVSKIEELTKLNNRNCYTRKRYTKKHSV